MIQSLKAPIVSVSYDTNIDLPTPQQYGRYQDLFNYFNHHLFSDKLPHVILNFSRKRKLVGGFFAPERWLGKDKPIHEISMNPESVRQIDKKVFVSIFVHEMVHLWQQEYGKVPRAGYHDKQWGDKMESIGLCPSNTGDPGGKKTGQQMTHYIIDGGLFDKAYDAMPANLMWPFTHVLPDDKPKKEKDKFKYTCEGCDTNVWGKDGISITCESCGSSFKREY